MTKGDDLGISLGGKVFSKTEAEDLPAEPFVSGKRWLLPGASVVLFVLVLAAHLIHHFFFDHALVMFAFDGKHYLETTRLLTEAGQLLFANPGAFGDAIATPHFTSYMLWDGPAIPGLPALLFLTLGRLPTTSDFVLPDAVLSGGRFIGIGRAHL